MRVAPNAFFSARSGIELFNSDYYNGFPNPAAIGNGGAVIAVGPPLDGFAQSAAITIPPNGALFFRAADS